ncbi:hypothetical protein [Parapedobacter tibetensis]|uniref:hypothetical protein n=1 Tax=Parapedobacter tibetensis TaxID=2972951 RepID=UPI00214D85B6|nr:hypothetical protein [Parapedobacter tibetensis]
MKEERPSKLKLIPLELADMMIKAYDKQRRGPASKKISRELGKEVEDSRSVWIGKEAILELLELNKADGIRLYFGIADDYPGHKLKRPEHKKRHTVVMVATKSKDSDNPTMENSVDCLRISKQPSLDKDNGGKIGPILMPISSSEAEAEAGLPADDINMCPPPPSGDGCLLPL